MRSEDVFMYSSSILLLILISVLYRFNKQFGKINIVIFVFYSPLLYYLFFSAGSGGSSLLWLFYIVVVTLMHSLVAFVLVIREWKK